MEKCEACKVKHHDSCSLTPGCPCCANTLLAKGYEFRAEVITRAPRFSVVSCSSCGQSFGPRDSGYSHCQDHAGRIPVDD